MVNIFDWHKIEHKSERLSGTAKLKCPNCIGERKNKQDRSLYVRYDSGVAKCFHCDSLSFRDSIEKKTENKSYKLPAQTWKNYTNLSDNMVKWFEKRGIHQYTLTEAGISEEMYYQPALKKEVNNICFNFFEGEMVVNKKYRSGGKHFTQSKDTKSIFYNINSAIGQKEVFIVEGEMDCLSLIQIGVKNVLSVPNGANDNDAYWINSEPYLKDVQRFFIGTDNDAKGNELAEKVAQRLGRYRCERINFEGKDANDDLVAGILESSLKNRSKYPVSGTFTANDLFDDMITLYDEGLPPVLSPKCKSFGNLKDVFSVMRGHLITGTGIPSHGKSNFTEWYVMNLVKDYDMKASFFSPEHHPMSLHKSTFVEKFTGKNYFRDNPDCERVTKIDIARYSEWSNQKIYLTGPDDTKGATWDWLLDKFQEQMFNYGIDIFVIDAFNKVQFTDNRPERERINNILTRLTSFAQNNNVIVFLIAHPTKMQKNDKNLYSIPDLYSVSGSADFRNQTHDGFCIYRYFADDETGEDGYTKFVNLKTKYKFQGEIGQSIDFDYHVPSGRYYIRGSEPNLYAMDYVSKNFEEQNNNFIPAGNVQDAFGDSYNTNDEIPF